MSEKILKNFRTRDAWALSSGVCHIINCDIKDYQILYQLIDTLMQYEGITRD